VDNADDRLDRNGILEINGVQYRRVGTDNNKDGDNGGRKLDELNSPPPVIVPSSFQSNADSTLNSILSGFDGGENKEKVNEITLKSGGDTMSMQQVVGSVIVSLAFFAFIGSLLFGGGGDTTGTAINVASSAISDNVGALSAADLAGMFDPAKFTPVCPASDGVYNVLKSGAGAIVGKNNMVEYGPLIASVLLRVRLELCVLESFLYEAIIPFIQKKGISWVLPLHETIETFVAGTVFALATNFILLGSTKIFTVLFVYIDALTGFPARNVGRLIKRSTPSNSPGAPIGAGLQGYGDFIGFIRQFLEGADTFVGRYLVVGTTAYIAFKFLHFRVFQDIFPF